MEVSFTVHRDDSPGNHYMAVASKEEWILLLLDLKFALANPNPVTQKLISEIERWTL